MAAKEGRAKSALRLGRLAPWIDYFSLYCFECFEEGEEQEEEVH